MKNQVVTPYPLCRNYNLLYQLAKAGLEIPCWVDYGRYDRPVYRDIAHVRQNLDIGARGISYGPFFFNDEPEEEQSKFVKSCEVLNLEYIKPTLHEGEWIVADIIGLGIYEIVSFSDYHVNVRCKKLFGNGWRDRDHITCSHRRPEKIDLVKWLTYKRVKR